MGTFLRENWIWILAPILLVLGVIVAIVVLSSSGDSPFVYPIF